MAPFCPGGDEMTLKWCLIYIVHTNRDSWLNSTETRILQYKRSRKSHLSWLNSISRLKLTQARRCQICSVHENRRTCRTFPMARPKCLMGDFTILNRIYKAHRTNVWWTMKVFRKHCFAKVSNLTYSPLTSGESLKFGVQVTTDYQDGYFLNCWCFYFKCKLVPQSSINSTPVNRSVDPNPLEWQPGPPGRGPLYLRVKPLMKMSPSSCGLKKP